MRDVVFVTVDCWRYDAVDRMDRLRSLTPGYDTGEAICQAPATRGAFPAILSSLYYPQAYAGFDQVRDKVRPLPAVLTDRGYATAGFVGSNPFLDAWSGFFDGFWNAGAPDGSGPADSRLGGRVRTLAGKARRAWSYARFRSTPTASDVARRARSWYEDQEGPRFLWMHLMDPHVPFLPGLRRGVEVGPFAAYRAHLQFLREPGETTEEQRRVLERLYWASVEHLDDQIERVLEFLDDDAIVVVVGDHGEEFDHAGYGHARLYDECVRVPLLTRGIDGMADGEVLRQVDLAPSVLDTLDCPVPDEWEGRPADGTYRDAFLLNHSPEFGHLYAGLRTDRYKLIHTMDEETRAVQRREAYDLREDPGETTDLYPDVPDRLEDRLTSFLGRDDIEGRLREREFDTSMAVEDRLKALGYK